MRKYWKHFKTITKHKLLVMKLCFKCGYIKRGLLHDLSKFGRTEFVSSAKHFQGNRSPIDAEKEEIGYSLAWQHHKGHNPHHWEYWLDNIGSGNIKAIKIPYEYIIEMLCDWLAAGIVYSKHECDFDKPYIEAFKYYLAHRHERIFHPETRYVLEYYLTYLGVYSINNFCLDCNNLKKDYENGRFSV